MLVANLVDGTQGKCERAASLESYGSPPASRRVGFFIVFFGKISMIRNELRLEPKPAAKHSIEKAMICLPN